MTGIYKVSEYYETSIWATPYAADEEASTLGAVVEERDRDAAHKLIKDDLVRLNLLNNNPDVVVGRVSEPMSESGKITIRDVESVDDEFEVPIIPTYHIARHDEDETSGDDILILRVPEKTEDEFLKLLTAHLHLPARLHDKEGRTIAYGNFIEGWQDGGTKKVVFRCSGLMARLEEFE